MATKNHNQITRYFEEYIKECKYSKVLRPATLKGYNDAFRNFTNLLPEIKELSDLKPIVFNVFFERLSIRLQLKGKELQDSTRYSYFQRLILFIHWLENNNHIETISDKIKRPPSPHYNDERALIDNEISKILTAIIFHNKNNRFLLTRDLMMFKILIYTGIRKAELLNIKVSDIDFESKTLRVNGNTSKSKKTRKIPLHPNVLFDIENYLEHRKQYSNEFLLLANRTYTALSEHGLVYWASRYKRLSKVKFHLHRCRHTFACNLAVSGADIVTVKNLMGHSSILMTERYLRSIGIKKAHTFIQMLYE